MQNSGSNRFPNGPPVDLAFPSMLIQAFFIDFEQKSAAIFAYVKHQMGIVAKLLRKECLFGKGLEGFNLFFEIG